MRSKGLFSLALYVHGQELDPADVSSRLNLEPTASRSRGQKLLPNRANSAYAKRGMWSLRTDFDGAVASEAIRAFVDRLKNAEATLRSVASAQEVYLDLFVAPPEAGEDAYLELEPHALSGLSELVLPLRIHFASVGSPDEAQPFGPLDQP